MATGQTLVDNVRARLLSGISEQRNRLAENYVAGSGTLTLEFPTTGIGPGTRLSVGQSVFYVWSSPASGVVVVQAAEDGSPDENHNDGETVRVNPRFTDYRIFQEVNTDLADLSAQGLFQMKTKEFTYNSQFEAFDLTGVSDLQQEYEIYAELPGSRKEWKRLDKLRWRVERTANIVDFPSGLALRIFSQLHNGYLVRLLYKAPFTPLATAAANMTTTGLPATAYDLPELGAFVTLVGPREVKRNMGEGQPEPRRQEQIPSGGLLRAAQFAAVQRRQRISAERARLHEQWSTRG